MHPFKYCTYIHLPQQRVRVVSVPNRQLPFLFDGRSIEGHTSHLLCQRALRLRRTWIQTPPSQEIPSLKLTAIAPENRKGNFHVSKHQFSGGKIANLREGSSDFSRHIGIMRFPTKVDDQSLRSLQRKPPCHWFFCQKKKSAPPQFHPEANLGCFHKSICLPSSFDLTNDPL